LFSDDPIALDAVACKIINMDPADVPTSKPGEKAGLGTYHFQNMEIVGDDMETFIDKSFDVVRKPPMSTPSGWLKSFLRNQLNPKPVIDERVCTNCGACIKQCPVNPKAVNWYTDDKSRPPIYKYDRCIRCYCCQELCPEGAINIKETLLSRILFH